MAEITASVGDRCRNQPHDVALVQAMLGVVQSAGKAPYLAGFYDGVFGGRTRDAIAKFQADHGLAAQATSSSWAPPPAPGAMLRPPAQGQPWGQGSSPFVLPWANPLTGGAAQPAWLGGGQTTLSPALADRPGVMNPGGATIRKLTELLPDRLRTMRTMAGCRLVYLPGTASDAAASANAIGSYKLFEDGFRGTLARLVNVMFERTGVVLKVTRDGWRRTFDEQLALYKDPRGVTGAGPGESNHNWGNGTDIGPNGIQWLRHDGTTVTDDWWLNKLDKVRRPWTLEFWRARNAIAVGELGLFPSKKAGDHVHLQAFDDGRVSMSRSLVALLNDVGALEWGYHGYVNDRNHYSCSLGGATKVDVGTAAQIWERASPIDAAAIAKATGKKPADVKPADVTAMQNGLRADFEAAERSFERWKAVYKS